MTEFVIDASAYLSSIGPDVPGELQERMIAAECHAPHLLDAEVGNVLRRRVLVGAIPVEVARRGMRALRHLVEHRYQHTGPLTEAAWALRENMTFYDALYVALATTLDLPLLTADARLTRAPGLPCQVELVA